MKPADIDDFVVWCALGIILGGRIGYVLFYDLPRFVANPMEILELWHGGMSFHGGFLGTMLAMLLFSRSRKIPFWSLVDVIAPSVTFGLFFGRLANFINGELFGRATDVPWAMVFPNGGPAPRYPSQLFEAFAEGILLFAIVNALVWTGWFRRPGFVAGIFGIGYAVARIVCEFFREPDPQLGFLFGANVDALSGGITMGMLLSVPVLIVGICLVWRSGREARV